MMRDRDTLKRWLQTVNWSYWETLTHMHDVTPRANRRAVQEYLSAWGPARAVWVCEHGRVGGRTHAHALTFYDREAPDPSRLWHWWHARYGRARIAPHEHGKGAAGYLLKSMDGAREDHMRRGVDWDVHVAPKQNLKPDEELPWET
jgi:GNAT superfamily N-acetyltransferase